MSQTKPISMEEYASECEQPEVLACLAIGEWVRRFFDGTQNGCEATEREAEIFQAAIDLMGAVNPDHPSFKSKGEDIRAMIAQMKEMTDRADASGQDSP